MHTPPTSRPVSINRGGQEAGVHRGKDPSLVFMRARALLLRTLGDSAARQSATDIRPLFLSASSPLFSRPLFPFSLSLLHTNQKRSWPNEQVAKRASTPGCGDLTRVLRKATYVFAVFPSFCSLLAFSYYLSDIGVFGKSIEGTDVNRDESDFLGWLKQPSSCKGN